VPDLRLHDIVNQIAPVASANDWFREYHRELSSPREIDKYDRYLADIFAFGGVSEIRGLKILEAGCGFGLSLVWSALRGGDAYGIDIYQPMIKTIDRYRQILPAELGSRIHAEGGDVAEMPFEDASFAVVVAIEAVSHYTELDAFMREAARVLQPGGVLIITDSNNALNPPTRRRKQEAYRTNELGPIVGPAAGVGVFTKPFVEKRQDLLREHFAFDDATVELLAERTSGLTRQRVLGAAELYSETGELPNSWFDPSNAPVDPESDTVIERLIDPYAMGRALRQAGFRRTRVQGYWGGASGKIHLRVANAALARLARLAIWSTPTFRIAAYR